MPKDIFWFRNLQEAVLSSDLAAVKKLISEKDPENSVNEKDSASGNTVLHYLAGRKADLINHDIVKELIRAGARLSEKNESIMGGKTPNEIFKAKNPGCSWDLESIASTVEVTAPSRTPKAVKEVQKQLLKLNRDGNSTDTDGSFRL